MWAIRTTQALATWVARDFSDQGDATPRYAAEIVPTFYRIADEAETAASAAEMVDGRLHVYSPAWGGGWIIHRCVIHRCDAV